MPKYMIFENTKENIDLHYERSIHQLRKRKNSIMFNRQENRILHNSLEWNEKAYEALISGDEKRILSLLMEVPAWEPGILAADSLRNSKNSYIGVIFYVANRVALERLADLEEAYALSDACIQLIEESGDAQSVSKMFFAGILEFANLVKTQKENMYHPVVSAAKDYIFKNLHLKIRLTDMALALGTNPSYLSRIFHEREKITIQDYIIEQRILRAQNMLKFTSYTVNEISQYLGFSSQSHLGKLLKARTGLTPLQYRRKYDDSHFEKM